MTLTFIVLHNINITLNILVNLNIGLIQMYDKDELSEIRSTNFIGEFSISRVSQLKRDMVIWIGDNHNIYTVGNLGTRFIRYNECPCRVLIQVLKKCFKSGTHRP